MANLSYRHWSPDEEAVLVRYYRRGMVGPLVAYYAQHHPPGRTRNAILNKARCIL